jgi:hypothetical protein
MAIALPRSDPGIDATRSTRRITMTRSHAASERREFRTPFCRRVARPNALARCASIAAPLLGAALLAAKRPASAGFDSLTTGLRYDIQMTTTSATTQNGQPTATTSSALAHVEIANGKVRIDIADGEFAAVAASGDFLLYTDTSHTATLVKPDLKQYFQVDFQKLGARLTNVVNLFGMGIGVQATNVKLDFASLGAGDKVGPFSTNKYRITQDYVLAVTFLGANQGKGTTMHSTTDYWFAPQLTMIVNPFANFVQETAWLGPTYGKQLAALQAKLPNGVPVKTIMTDVGTDSAGTKTTTTVTWELTNFVRADIPDAAYQVPAGYTPLQAPTALVQPFGTSGQPAGSNGTNPASGLVNGNSLQALQAMGGNNGTGALNTLLKAAQSAPPTGGTGSPGAPTTTWNGNGSTQSAGSSSPWSAATSAAGSTAAGQNGSTTAPATTGQDTTNAAGTSARKGRSQ